MIILKESCQPMTTGHLTVYRILVVIPYISMHGSTEMMVDYLVSGLAERNIKVEKFELTSTDLGKLAMALVDAATIVIGTPTVHVGAHPSVYSITHLANALRPKLKYAAVIGSYGWGTKAVEQIAGLIPNLKVEILGTVMCKGRPKAHLCSHWMHLLMPYKPSTTLERKPGQCAG